MNKWKQGYKINEQMKTGIQDNEQMKKGYGMNEQMKKGYGMNEQMKTRIQEEWMYKLSNESRCYLVYWIYWGCVPWGSWGLWRPHIPRFRSVGGSFHSIIEWSFRSLVGRPFRGLVNIHLGSVLWRDDDLGARSIRFLLDLDSL